MAYSQEKPFESREHIIWEIGYCGRAATYIVVLGLIFAISGVISDLLNTKLGLGATSWLLLAVAFSVVSLGPHLHMVMAKHLLGTELIKKD
jgi:hypothetical protein